MNRLKDREAKKRKRDWQTKATKTNKLKKERATDINQLFEKNMETVVRPVIIAVFGAVFYLISMIVIPISIYFRPLLPVVGCVGVVIYLLLSLIYIIIYNKYKKHNKELRLNETHKKWVSFSNHLAILGYIATSIGYILYLYPDDESLLSFYTIDKTVGIIVLTAVFAVVFIYFVIYDFFKKTKNQEAR